MSMWSPFGTSDFPLNQPMVGQKEFYDTFRSFTKMMKKANMATIFPLISKWGIGKSRIGFEVISEPLGMDKGWIISEDGEQKEVRIFKSNFEDKVLPLYIRYSQMCHEDLIGDNWVAYGMYIALIYLSKEPDGSIQGKIVESIQNALLPMGFDRETLGAILEIESTNIDDLVIEGSKLDKLTRKAIDYIKKFNIEHILVVCDELETAGEIAKYGIEKDKELQSKIDGEAIQVITNAIKHEDPRKKYPEVSFLLLCSTVIGGSIQGIGALDRRTEMYEMLQNSFADISDFTEYLSKKGMIPEYPNGTIEAAYTIAGGNFGWFNVIMHNVDQRMEDETIKKETGYIFENILNSSNRFKESLIDKSSFDYIECNDKFKETIKHALLKQIPDKKDCYSSEAINAMLDAKDIEGGKLFKEFYCVKLKKDKIGSYLNSQGYKKDIGDVFINNIGGNFDLEVLLRSLKTFSIGVGENEYIVGKEEETFLDQIRMLYPKEEVEEAAKYLYSYVIENLQIDEVTVADYIGPNFAFLSKINRRYRVDKDKFGYVPDSDKNKEIEKLLLERSKNRKDEVKRILSGACRALELSYPEENFYSINGIDCVRTKVENGPFLDVHNNKIVDVIWGKDEEKLKEVLLDNKLMKDGVHPIIVLSDSVISKEYTEKFVKDKYDGIGKCLIFINITRLQKDILEVISLDKEILDIRENKNIITPIFREKVRKIRDYIQTTSNEWFDRVDSEGWVLRPIIYKKQSDSAINILPVGFKQMLIHDLDSEEVGSQKDYKLSQSEYTEFTMALKNILIGKLNEGQGYKETGLFVKDDNGNFTVAIPSCVNRILKFNSNCNKSVKEYEDKFFFSVSKDIKTKKIVDQWIAFMIGINLLTRTKDGFIGRISSYELKGKYDMVKKWLDEDCKEEIKSMKKVINGPYLKVLEDNQIPYYKGKLQEAEGIRDKIKIELLEVRDINTYNNFKDVIGKIVKFDALCREVYDKDGWNNINSYNPNIIKDIKIDDKEKPLWFRIRHIHLFIDYINNLKVPAEKSIVEKIEEVKKTCVYEDIMLPISPITNILEKYCNELQNSTDYKKMTMSGTGTMVTHINTLAYKLQDGDFSGAAMRIEEILEYCGLEPIENSELKWSNDKGIIGEYKNIYKGFKFVVEGYKKKAESERWIKYFSDAPANLKNNTDVKNLDSIITQLDFFINGGLEQDVDDAGNDMLSKPEEFMKFLKDKIEDMYQNVGMIDGYKNNVMNLAKVKKNEFRDEDLIKTIDRIRNHQGLSPASIEIRMDEYPKENLYSETKTSMEGKMNVLENEGEKFFKTSSKIKKTTFSFYKEVITKDGEVDWDNHLEEMKELLDIKIIRQKIEV